VTTRDRDRDRDRDKQTDKMKETDKSPTYRLAAARLAVGEDGAAAAAAHEGHQLLHGGQVHVLRRALLVEGVVHLEGRGVQVPTVQGQIGVWVFRVGR